MAPLRIQLQPSGAYGRLICGYTDEDQAHKDAFLRDGHRLLKAAGTLLATVGLSQADIRKNRGGMAVSGEVYADFYPSDPTACFLHVWLQQSCISVGRERTDHVAIIARWHQPYPDPRPQRTARSAKKPVRPSNYEMGPNHWINANLDHYALAARLGIILGLDLPAAPPPSRLARAEPHSQTTPATGQPAQLAMNL